MLSRPKYDRRELALIEGKDSDVEYSVQSEVSLNLSSKVKLGMFGRIIISIKNRLKYENVKDGNVCLI